MPSTERTSTSTTARASSPSAARPRRRSVTAAPAMPADAVGPSGLPRDERVRRLAYAFYEQRGGSDGQAMDDWLRAEMAVQGDEVQATRSATDGH